MVNNPADLVSNPADLDNNLADLVNSQVLDNKAVINRKVVILEGIQRQELPVSIQK